jgi:thiopeptide-type bacteriocin biosynthesis protein
MRLVTLQLEEFRQSYLIDKIQLDTYQRELDRYGYDCAPLFEKIFYHDSKMNIRLIQHCEDQERSLDLWICGLYSMHTLCQIFELNEEKKEQFLGWILQSFRSEFNAYSETTKGLNYRYNEQKNRIHQLFLQKETTGFNTFVEIVQERDRAIKELYTEIANRYPALNDRFRFLNSVIHMSINRLFRSRQRMYEFVITDFLKRISTTMKYTQQQALPVTNESKPDIERHV